MLKFEPDFVTRLIRLGYPITLHGKATDHQRFLAEQAKFNELVEQLSELNESPWPDQGDDHEERPWPPEGFGDDD